MYISNNFLLLYHYFLNYLNILLEARQIDCISVEKKFKSAGKLTCKSKVAPRGNEALLRPVRGYVR